MASGKKYQKLSTKFALSCVLPASLLLIAVCCVSLMITSRNLLQSMRKSMEMQATSRSDALVDSLDKALSNAGFQSKVYNIQRNLKNEEYEGVREVLSRISRSSSCFNNVSVYDFSSADACNVYTEKSNSSIKYTPEWYDEEQFSQSEGYFVTQDITHNADRTLMYYVYPFKSPDSDKNDRCFLASVSNDVALRMLELSNGVDESRWMIVSDKGKILYHSMEYKKEVFDMIEEKTQNESELSSIHEFNGRLMLIVDKKIPEIDSIRVIYVVPVERALKDITVSLIITIGLTIISICILAFFISYMTKQMVDEIKAIRQSLSGIHEKKFVGVIKSENRDEMGDLVDDFNKVINLLTYQAEHDENTGFYNSRAFAEKARRIISENKGSSRYAVIRSDIDNFSFINDIFDWSVGNSILRKIAAIIKDVFKDAPLHGYLGNDIFVVLYRYDEEDNMYTDIKKAADRIRKCDNRIQLVPHFGIADELEPETEISVACDYAGVALKTIKGNMLREFITYNNDFKNMHNMQKYVESNKQSALDNGDFYIQFQPKCDIVTGRVVGAEALVRWKRSDTGEIIPPVEFIPIFEKNGFVITLDRYVWEETCKVIKHWQDMDYHELPVSVNVSRVHINNPHFVAELYALVRKYGIKPELLEIEITESALLEKGDAELESVMDDLKTRGFRLLMDDFASGYSSLISLQKLPFDVIKIDKALIDDVDDQENRKFVAGAVSFILDLGKEIVVEGVENEVQRKILAEAGCSIIQGFCFSKPLDIADFEKIAFAEDTNRKNTDPYEDDDPLNEAY
ncbi:bifunctional diguanylate cyclase/phosphodiesterase [Ruminococcus sp. HUN007]|uniref:putative bifunctional diguanylate cyclase/phosphodiesterase n=1 Tax=Ruminococcus sp. HUN007 TaxID=1514668 RepID=UPI0009DFB3CD|nr:bifunctional diguanylate cyclase/phosphodiesterase [Ruminococcus sp. HUN007]